MERERVGEREGWRESGGEKERKRQRYREREREIELEKVSVEERG